MTIPLWLVYLCAPALLLLLAFCLAYAVRESLGLTVVILAAGILVAGSFAAGMLWKAVVP